MKDFVNKILGELTTNENIKSDPVIQILVESTNKSIALGESYESVYNALKTNLTNINKHSKNTQIDTLLEEFNKNDDTVDSKLAKLVDSGNLKAKLSAIKEAATSNPIIASQVESFENALNGGVPEISLYSAFLQTFEKYNYDSKIKNQLNALKTHINENNSKLVILGTIFEMERTGAPVYAGVKNSLKELLVTESYSADVLKVKFGTVFPLINNLINDLRVLESQKEGSFTLGEGDGNTKIRNVIAPTLKIDEGFIILNDNRFLSITKSKKLTGDESEVYVNEDFTISAIKPEVVKEKYPKFYELCESYSILGFTPSEDGLGVDSSALRTFKLGFRVNEAKELELFVNGNKVEDPKTINLSESLVLESESIKHKITSLFENFKDILHFEFMKEVSNDLTMNEALVVNLNESFFICEKPNTAQRIWNKVSEMQMYEYFANNFKYDISSLFKVKLEKGLEKVREIEAEKSKILENVEKLEQTIEKLNQTINSNEITPDSVSQLETIKESVEKTIKELKDDFVKLDLSKKTI